MASLKAMVPPASMVRVAEEERMLPPLTAKLLARANPPLVSKSVPELPMLVMMLVFKSKLAVWISISSGEESVKTTLPAEALRPIQLAEDIVMLPEDIVKLPERVESPPFGVMVKSPPVSTPKVA